MKLLLLSIAAFVFASCVTTPIPAIPGQEGRLTRVDLVRSISDKRSSESRTADLRGASSTGAMIEGLDAMTGLLKPTYIRMVKKTRGVDTFGRKSPDQWVEDQISPAARAAAEAYDRRFRAGMDGSAGRLDAPSARYDKLEQLIDAEVRNHTSPALYNWWNSQWDK